MSVVNKVVWSEGMFLRHQHFQQSERSHEYAFCQMLGMINPTAWGVSELEIDTESLKLGKFTISKCAGIFMDKTIFNSEGNACIPATISIPVNAHNCTIYLAIPSKGTDLTEVRNPKDSDTMARYLAKSYQVKDINSGGHDTAEVFLSQLQLRLLTDEDDISQFSCIPIARVSELDANGGIILDRTFIPSCINCSASNVLKQNIIELQSLLNNRSLDISARLGKPSGADSIGDLLLLQLVNRYALLFSSLSNHGFSSTINFFNICLQLAGEMATYSTPMKRLTETFDYSQSDLTNTFSGLINTLKGMLSSVLLSKAMLLELQQSKQGIWVSITKDQSIYSNSNFILAVKSDMASEDLAGRVITQAKVGPVEKIRSLINLQLVGIELRQLTVIPREIPYKTGYLYFELDKTSPLWSDMMTSNAIAIHFSGEFPGLGLELWAIKETNT